MEGQVIIGQCSYIWFQKTSVTLIAILQKFLVYIPSNIKLKQPPHPQVLSIVKCTPFQYNRGICEKERNHVMLRICEAGFWTSQGSTLDEIHRKQLK